jgi:RNA polymerase sigma factor (sigma-70 family)
MTSRPLNAVLQRLRAAGERDGAGSTDGELLTRFLNQRDDDALAALVERHGPMVWGVCRRVLRNPHDAEDAFQATFLVLVSKAATVAPREMVANWLYGVAHQTAVRLRATAAKRGVREMQLKEKPEPAVAEARVSELLPFLDQELSRLPERFRGPIVLCDLEGKTRKEAARQLGCPEGTVASRLARARDVLAKRMARHGLAVSGGSLGAALSQSGASAGVPDAVVSGTIQVATLLAANQAAGAISGPVAALAEGVLKTMLLKKIMATTMVVVALGVAAITGGSLAVGQTEGAGQPADQPPTTAEKPIDRPPAAAVAAKDAVVNTPTILGKLQGEWELQPKTEGEYKQRMVFTASSSGNWQRSKETLPVSITYYVEGRELLIQFYHEPNGAFNYRLKQLRFEYKLDEGILTLTAGDATQTWKRVPKAALKPEGAKAPPEKEAIAVPASAKAEPAKPKPTYVTVVGQLLDDTTGRPIEKAGWEWGQADPKKPGQIAWGHTRQSGGSYPGGKFEMLVNIGANGHHHPLRVYSAGYETTIVIDDLAKPYPEKIERIVRLKRGRNITGVLRDHAGKPVANGWVFFIPKGHRANIVEGIPGTDAYELPGKVRDGAVADVRTNADGTFALSTGADGTLAASTDLVDLWPFPLPDDGQADLKMPAPSYLVIDLTYWYLDELAKKGKRELSPNSEDPNQCWLAIDREWSAAEARSGLGYRRQMLVFAKDPRAKLSKGVIVGHVIEGEMPQPIPGVGHNKNISTKIRVALPAGSYRVQRLRAGPFAPVGEQQVELKAGEDTVVSWARGDGSSVRGKATWPANMMFVRQPGEKPRKLDWTVPDTATVWIAPVGGDGKPIEAAKIQPDGSFFIATNLDPGKYKATARVYLPEGDFRGGKWGSDCEFSQEFTVPDPARGPTGSPPVEVEIRMNVGAGGRFVETDPPAVPAKPVNMVEPPAEKRSKPLPPVARSSAAGNRVAERPSASRPV